MTDQTAAAMVELLGARTIGSVAITRDQEHALYRLYGFDLKRDDHPLMQAGAFRNMARYAQQDGVRLVAFLAQFCKEGEDPLVLVKEALADAGFDVAIDI